MGAEKINFTLKEAFWIWLGLLLDAVSWYPLKELEFRD